MPNYSLVLDTRFNPFSYSEMLAPVLAATQAHQAVEEEYGSLAQKASVWEQMANEQTDPYAYRMYKTYSNDLENMAKQLAKNGLSPASRKNMLNMKSRYSKEIIPIETAYKRREELSAEQRKAIASNPTLRYQRMANTMSLDDFIKNPSLDYGESYSGALLTQQVSQAAANYAKVLAKEGKLESLGLPFQYKQRLKYGASPEEVLAVINNAALEGHQGAVNFLKGVRDQVLQSSGVADWADPATMKEFEAFANQGLYSALGQTTINNIKDDFSMSDALDARRQARSAAYAAQQQAVQGQAARGNLPIDIHHLVSPNQLGEKGAKTADIIRARLGLAKTYDGKTAKWATKIDLGGLVTMRSDMINYKFKNTSGGSTVKIFNDKGVLLSRDEVVKQGRGYNSQRALGEWYDRTVNTLKENISPNKNGQWTARDIMTQTSNMKSGKGAITMGAMRINFGADNNKKALETLLPGLTSGDKTQIYEITNFDADGNITKGKRASTKDFLDDKGNSKSTPMFYAAPNANTDGLIMQFNGKTYLIPRNKLGSLGEQVYNINIPELQKANQLKQSLIEKYGADAYYGSEEGLALEQTIDNYGAAYLRAAGTTLGYSYEPPKYGIKESNQTEI